MAAYIDSVQVSVLVEILEPGPLGGNSGQQTGFAGLHRDDNAWR